MHGAEAPPPLQYGRGDDWLDELKAHSTYLKLWKDRATYVIASQPFVTKDNRVRPLTSPAISPQNEGHSCRDQYTAQSEMKVNAARIHRKPLAYTHTKVLLPAGIFQSE